MRSDKDPGQKKAKDCGQPEFFKKNSDGRSDHQNQKKFIKKSRIRHGPRQIGGLRCAAADIIQNLKGNENEALWVVSIMLLS